MDYQVLINIQKTERGEEISRVMEGKVKRGVVGRSVRGDSRSIQMTEETLLAFSFIHEYYVGQ